jgi:hypothetical protein
MPTRRRGAPPAAPLLGPAVRARPPGQRLNEFREDLPVWDYSDADARAAFVWLMLGVLLSPLALLGNLLYVQSPNKRAWLYSVKGLLLGLLTLVLAVVCLAQTLSVPATGTPGGAVSLLAESITTAVTCGNRGNPCCARAGVLTRFIASCDDVGFIDPTGERCIKDTFGICSWQNGTATNTMAVHCHSQGPDDPEPHCHFHAAAHVLGSEPGDVK